MNYHLYVHPHTSKKSSRASLYYAVTINGQCKEVPSGISVPASSYDKNTRTIIPTDGYDTSVIDNLHLQQGIARWEKILKLLDLQGNLTLESALEEWEEPNHKDVQNLAIQVIDNFIEEESIIKSWGDGTIKKFHVLQSRIKEYNASTKIDDITEEWIISFMNYLSKGYPITHKDKSVTMHSYRNTSLAKMLKQFRWFLRWAKKKGIYHGNAQDFTMDFRGGTEPLSDIVYLTSDELHLLQEHKWKPQQLHLERVVDVFLFACFCGLRYSDIATLRRYHIHDGQIHCEIDKTHVKVSIPLNKVTSAILDKYASFDDGTDRPFPVISNQRSNEYIKDACRICGIDSPVTRIWYVGNTRHEESHKKHEIISFHCARRTFITQALVLGIPDAVLIQMTGHTTTKMLTRYQGVVDDLKKKMISKFDTL